MAHDSLIFLNYFSKKIRLAFHVNHMLGTQGKAWKLTVNIYQRSSVKVNEYMLFLY